MKVDESLLFGRSASAELLELETGSKPPPVVVDTIMLREMDELRNEVQSLKGELHAERTRHAGEAHEAAASLHSLQDEIDR